MKVGPIPGTAQINPYTQPQRTRQTSGAAAQDTDKVDLDQSACQLEGLLEAAKDVPDVRIDKVEELKRQIEAGEYKPDSKAVAEKLLEQMGL